MNRRGRPSTRWHRWGLYSPRSSGCHPTKDPLNNPGHLPCSPINGNGLAGPWAVAVDGNDNIWVSNFVSDKYGIVQLCGANPAAWPPGKKMGDAISPPGGYVGGGLQMQVDIDIDPAGNIWVSNNWQNIESVLDRNAESLSTRGAG